MMNKDEITRHLSAKKRYPSYPSLPKMLHPDLSTQEKAKYKALNAPSKRLDALGTYEQSVVRGFLMRVSNWEKNELPTLLAKEALLASTVYN